MRNANARLSKPRNFILIEMNTMREPNIIIYPANLFKIVEWTTSELLQ